MKPPVKKLPAGELPPEKPASRKTPKKNNKSPLKLRLPLKVGLLLLVCVILLSKWVDPPLKDGLLLVAMVIALWTAFSLSHIHSSPPQHTDTVFFPTAPSIKTDELVEKQAEPKVKKTTNKQSK